MPSTMTDMSANGKPEPKHSGRIWIPPSAQRSEVCVLPFKLGLELPKGIERLHGFLSKIPEYKMALTLSSGQGIDFTILTVPQPVIQHKIRSE